MIEAYRARQENAVLLARAAAVATDESFKAVMREAFPPPPRRAAAGSVQKRWWGRDRS